jgi:hypothetical protein
MATDYRRLKNSPILDECLMLSKSELNQTKNLAGIGQKLLKCSLC